MDTANSSSPQGRPWAMWAALAMIAVGLVAFLYVVFSAASKPEASSGLTRFARGEMENLVVVPEPPPLPLRPIQDVNGAETSLGALKGQVIVLNVWYNECAPCIHEMPSLAALQARYEGRIHVAAVSIEGEAGREEAKRKLAELTRTRPLPFYIDISRGVLFDVGARGFPTTIIYDRDGVEVARLAGGADWASDDAMALIDAVLAGEG